jgi:(p)ppGpp synthase/HD superfamily hydrolase
MDQQRIDTARAYSKAMHDSAPDPAKRVRKYTGEPYWVHPFAVADLLQRVALVEDTDVIVAALLHDVFEDTAAKREEVFRLFGGRATRMAISLTDVWTKENFPHLNRALRSQREAQRLSYESQEVQTIKLADLIDNTRSIMVYDPGFAKTYIPEKARLIDMLTLGNTTLRTMAKTMVDVYHSMQRVMA